MPSNFAGTMSIAKEAIVKDHFPPPFVALKLAARFILFLPIIFFLEQKMFNFTSDSAVALSNLNRQFLYLFVVSKVNA